MVRARDIWSKIPMPAMAKKVIHMSKTGVYVFRVTYNVDIFGKDFYKVETRNVFGGMDDFCDDFTDNFNDRKTALDFYNTAKREARKEYQRLKYRQKERMKGGIE